MDGEGFSPEAIAYFKMIYGEDFYEGQLQKMYAVCGDNEGLRTKSWTLKFVVSRLFCPQK